MSRPRNVPGTNVLATKLAGTVHIGTSGWHYKHWLGPFYPAQMPASKMLEFYAQHFDTVELNNTFYRLPLPSGLAQWRDGSPDGFCFAAKGSRFITHMKKLKDPEPAVAKYFERVFQLGDKLGPVVFQLPPFWEVAAARLDEFLKVLPPGLQYAFEFRNPTWHAEAIYKILRRHNAAFCIFEVAGFHSPLEITADFTYMRLHGPGGAYQGSYSEATLDLWAARIHEWRRSMRGIYIYFDNDERAFAVQNALALRKRAVEAAIPETVAGGRRSKGR